jgi:hypothetical protein
MAGASDEAELFICECEVDEESPEEGEYEADEDPPEEGASEADEEFFMAEAEESEKTEDEASREAKRVRNWISLTITVSAAIEWRRAAVWTVDESGMGILRRVIRSLPGKSETDDKKMKGCEVAGFRAAAQAWELVRAKTYSPSLADSLNNKVGRTHAVKSLAVAIRDCVMYRGVCTLRKDIREGKYSCMSERSFWRLFGPLFDDQVLGVLGDQVDMNLMMSQLLNSYHHNMYDSEDYFESKCSLNRRPSKRVRAKPKLSPHHLNPFATEFKPRFWAESHWQMIQRIWAPPI